MAASVLGGALLSAAHAAATAVTATPIQVTITETKVTFSRRSVAVGPALFEVANKGKIAHVFKLAGKSTPAIAPGRTSTLRVTIVKTGPYAYYSVSPRRVPALTGALSIVDPCTRPVDSRITVEMHEAPITFSQETVPCGTVTFVVTNAGIEVHSLDLFQTNPPRTLLHGPTVESGATTTLVVRLLVKGSVNYLCGQPEHGETYGEVGFLTVD